MASLSEDDIVRIGEVVENKINAAITPIQLQCERFKVTLHGANGDNGLTSEVKGLRSRLRTLERVSYVWHGAVSAALTFLGMQK
jgi:hypothetical protein